MELQQETFAGRPALFTKKALLTLIIPLVIERLLDMTVGMADTVMVSSVGEAAISGVALVDGINNLILFVIAALASGGAVVVSQYIGRSEIKNARTASKQLIYVTTAVAMVLAALLLAFRQPLLRAVFGALEPDVMRNALAYCWITALSFPFAAMYNSAAAIFRSMGNSKVTMFISLLMNIVNIGGNAILIYAYKMGSAGAAIASLLSRIVAAVVLLVLIRNTRNILFVRELTHFEFYPQIVKNILKIGVPSGLENGMFHLGRILVQSIVTTFGTVAIAANAAASQITNLANVPGSAISLAIITVVGQCIGARDIEQMQYNTKRLMKYIYLSSSALYVLAFLFAAPCMQAFHLGPEATAWGIRFTRTSAAISLVVWPMAFPFANVLRAAGDARFTMTVSVLSMWICRIGMGYLFCYVLHVGLMGVWYGMYMDWTLRALIFLARYLSGAWKTKQVIA